MVGIWVIVCVQKPSRHFLQTFRPKGVRKEGGLGLTPLEFDMLQRLYHLHLGD